MLNKLSEFFKENLSPDSGGSQPDNRKRAIKMATAALLVEMARADYDETKEEFEHIAELLRIHFSLDDEETEALLELARSEADRAISLHEFTSVLHQHLTPDEKHDIVEMLWKIAYADSELNKYEDYLVRKIAELLYISHADFIRLKHKAKAALDK
ncbi:MAG: TerB family tellurite resistance protein [Gammaproteobacteria bacterium]|nr:TerB family tellurite resistance protein [Gammaproteobacteria bacterium]